MAKTIQQLYQQAEVIMNMSTAGGNTKTIVGGEMWDIVEKLEEILGRVQALEGKDTEKVQYTINYLEQSTFKVLKPAKVGQGQGSTVVETAPTISNYTAIAPTSVTLTLTEGSSPVHVFYYQEKDKQYVYFGLLNSETITTQQISALSGRKEVTSVIGDYTINATASQVPAYVWFCVPKSMTISSIVGNSGIGVPLENGIVVGEYRCYRFSNLVYREFTDTYKVK